MEEYLTDVEHEIFIIEQSDDKPFNRGKLLNVGYGNRNEAWGSIAICMST